MIGAVRVPNQPTSVNPYSDPSPTGKRLSSPIVPTAFRRKSQTPVAGLDEMSRRRRQLARLAIALIGLAAFCSLVLELIARYPE